MLRSIGSTAKPPVASRPLTFAWKSRPLRLTRTRSPGLILRARTRPPASGEVADDGRGLRPLRRLAVLAGRAEVDQPEWELVLADSERRPTLRGAQHRRGAPVAGEA